MRLVALRALFQVPTDNARLMRAQFVAFSRQVPLLYFILIVNTFALAWTHRNVAPSALTIFCPALFSLACAARAWMWMRIGAAPIDDVLLARRLKTTVVLAGGLGVSFLSWGLALFPYGDASARAHVVFYIAITLISSVFCLMHLRAAALALTLVVVIPFTAFLAWTGGPTALAIAFNMVLVAAAMVYVLVVYSRDFANMVDFQERMVAPYQAEAIQARRNADAQLTAQREILKQAGRFEVALNNMLHGLCMFDLEDRLIVCNERYAKMYALPEALARPGTAWRDIVEHRLRMFGYRGLGYEDVLAQHRAIDLKKSETTTTREMGDGRTILIRHQPIKEGGWVATHEDISERQRAEERLSYLARHDALTGLANRVLFQEQMEAAVAGLERGAEFAVLCLDLDHFKEANDTLGHAVGDALLREVAARLKACIGDNDTVARIGGDEFAIVQVGTVGVHDCVDLAKRLLDALTKPYEVEDHQVNIGASVGIACAPRDHTVGALLLRLADIALYRAKSEGRRTYRFFEASMDSALQSRRRLELDLRRALIGEELEVYYQPINDARTRSIRSFEALVRWRHPDRGLISPIEFISLAEDTGLIVPLGEWVLASACKEATRWPSEVGVSVNLSACQFKADNLARTVRTVLAETGLPARRLELEITESVLLAGSSDNLAILHELRGIGVKIAMDDFGTGYSSLSYLRSFPFDKIKIDQSFVKNIHQRDAREIVRAIASLGQTLGMTTTAEGVETEAQLSKMIEYNCTEVQGYLFSRPAPASHVPALLERFQPLRRVA